MDWTDSEDVGTLFFAVLICALAFLATWGILWLWYTKLAFPMIAQSAQESKELYQMGGLIALGSTLFTVVVVCISICVTTYKFRQLELNHKKEKRRDEFMREYEHKQEQALRTTTH